MRMSREHLYKAKRMNWRELPKDEWWVEGALFEGKENSYIVTNVKVTDKWENSEIGADVIGYLVDPETVCEYVGLTDRKGMKIFENDIFHIGDKNIPYFVEWHDTRFMGKAVRAGDRVGLLYWRECIEIMGNLHDNPEFLKGDEAK